MAEVQAKTETDVKKLIADLVTITQQLKSGKSIDIDTALEMITVVDKYGGVQAFGGEYLWCRRNIIFEARKHGFS